ncbi:putative kinesin [Trypanosoma cruzi]|nr:putative kinesin [Trypanosoma cruzi]
MPPGFNRVTVGVRVRPKLDDTVNALQRSERYEPMACSRYSDTTLRVWDGRPAIDSRTFFFSYDAVFDEDTLQEEIYEELAMDVVDDVLRGTNATILTYGQTGSGKTHTVLGRVQKSSVGDDIITSDTGILLRALQDILHHAEINRNKFHIVVGLSAVEIYLDEVRDLLSDEQQPTAVQMSLVRDVVRFGKLTYVSVCCLEDGLRVFQRATARRMQRMTSANDTSSRSHAVFTIEVFQQPITFSSAQPLDLLKYISMREAAQLAQLEGKAPRMHSNPMFPTASQQLFGEEYSPVMHSKLSLVDLAGSEKVRNANVKGDGFDELKKINASLSALGNVVHSLHEGSRHIPYRDSKLTTILRDSFATASARVVLIVNVSPTTLTVDETLSSLYFADKVKAMKPDPRSGGSDENDMVCEYLSLLRKYEALIADVHIAGEIHMFTVPQIIPLVADDQYNVLYDPAFHLRRPECEIRRMAASMMCEAFKASASGKNQSLVEQQQMEAERRLLRKEMVTDWKKRWNSVCTQIENFSTQAEGQGDAEERALMDEVNMSLARVEDARVMRCGMQKKHQKIAECLEEAGHTLRALEEKLMCADDAAVDPVAADSTTLEPREAHLLNQGEESWARLSEFAACAVHSATLRDELCRLMCETQRLSGELARQEQRHQWQWGAAPQPQSNCDWLRHVVCDMAGNAVGTSLKPEEELRHGDPMPLGSHLAFNDDSVPPPHQYWKSQSVEGSDAGKKCRGTRFDTAELLEDIYSFVKMGGKVMKYSRGGLPHRRLLYVDGKAGNEQLSWSVAGMLGREDRIPLRSVRQILLGRPCAPTGSSLYYTSWGVVSQQENKTKITGFACDTVAEFEAWVLGISQLTGVKPTFGEPMKIQSETEAKWNALSEKKRAFCAEWHIPPPVFIEAEGQITSRGKRSRHSGLRLTPGELRNLVKLDIFRASAMWLHFFAEGLVVNATNTLYCHVELRGMPKVMPKRMKSATNAESCDGASLKSMPLSSDRRGTE